MKTYNKLDAYFYSEAEGCMIYAGSSNAFKTMKAYKQWLLSREYYANLTLKIVRSE